MPEELRVRHVVVRRTCMNECLRFRPQLLSQRYASSGGLASGSGKMAGSNSMSSSSATFMHHWSNDSHDWRIYADFAQVLIRIARPLYAADPIGVDLDHSLYALDSTTIDLCLSLFPWAKFRRHKGAVKMHTLLDLH